MIVMSLDCIVPFRLLGPKYALDCPKVSKALRTGTLCKTRFERTRQSRRAEFYSSTILKCGMRTVQHLGITKAPDKQNANF